MKTPTIPTQMSASTQIHCDLCGKTGCKDPIHKQWAIEKMKRRSGFAVGERSSASSGIPETEEREGGGVREELHEETRGD